MLRQKQQPSFMSLQQKVHKPVAALQASIKKDYLLFLNKAAPAFFKPTPVLSHQQLDDHDDQCCNKQQQAQTVNAMHVFDPLRVGPVRVGFAQVKVFGQLFQHSHNIRFVNKHFQGPLGLRSGVSSLRVAVLRSTQPHTFGRMYQGKRLCFFSLFSISFFGHARCRMCSFCKGKEFFPECHQTVIGCIRCLHRIKFK